jgi:hypothetical protein
MKLLDLQGNIHFGICFRICSERGLTFGTHRKKSPRRTEGT